MIQLFQRYPLQKLYKNKLLIFKLSIKQKLCLIKSLIQVLHSTPDQSKSGFSLSHDEIGQSPPSFSCYLNLGVEYDTWAKSFYNTYSINGFSSYFNQNRGGSVGVCGGGGEAHTPLFCQIIIKSALNWLEYTNKNLWGGESPTTLGLAIAFKH